MMQTLFDLCVFADRRVAVAGLNLDTYISTENMLPNKEGITRSAGLPAVTQVQAYHAEDVLVLRTREGCNPVFLYYLLSDDSFFDYATATAKGTKMPRGDKDAIMQYEVPDLPLDIQIGIADVLSALDGRIATNKAINHHLEQIAQAIFKSRFVDFEPFEDGGFVESELGEIPVGWSTLPIEAIAEKVAMGPFGSNIKVETFVGSGVPIISGNHLRELYLDELSYNFVTEEHARRLSNSLVRAGDIVFTHAGNIGQVALIPDDCEYPYYVISQRQFYLRCDRQKAVPEYINYYFHNREGQGKLLANASQTGVPSIVRPSSHLKAIIVPIPPIEIQMEWLDTVKPMFQTLNNNSKETKRLTAVRDSLLPRLMSGELSVTALSGVK
ncbi:MAG: restriction endonuclease subunit S [Treponema sp.]|jgi:type I restriction enzyme S subunit|nr:restriction endonuclease subunit S [Treponema sp.]